MDNNNKISAGPAEPEKVRNRLTLSPLPPSETPAHPIRFVPVVNILIPFAANSGCGAFQGFSLPDYSNNQSHPPGEFFRGQGQPAPE
jgi:hypothetical protein